MEMEKIGCKICHGMGQVEQESAGPVDCPACKGKGHVEVIKRVEHFEPVKIDIKRGK